MEVEDERLSFKKQTAQHLWDVGNFLSIKCPPVSRYCIYTLERKHKFHDLLKNKPNKMYCSHCGCIWHSENCRIRILRRPHINSHIAKLQKMETIEPWRLNNRQKKKLRKFYESKSKTVYRCFSCKKKTIFPGSNTCKVKKPAESTNTLVPKIKLNKKELNAGLFIPSVKLARFLAS